MRKFSDIVSPGTLIFSHFCAYLALALLFHANFLEVSYLIAADFLSLLAGKKIEANLFSKKYPWSFYYLDGVKFDVISHFNQEQKQHLLDSLIQFPQMRARFLLLASIPKIIPAILVIIFIWNHGMPIWPATFKIIMAEGIILSYFYAVVYCENHIHASKVIADLHKRFNFSEAFKSTTAFNTISDPLFRESNVLISFWVSVLGLQLSLVLTPVTAELQNQRILETITVGALGLSLFTRVWYLNRNMLREGLVRIFNAFNAIQNPEDLPDVLPLHSSPLLAKFEMTYNSLMLRLQNYRAELTARVFRQTESSRYRALGEISGLVVHDLSAPLHVIKFCTDELKQNPGLIEKEDYIRNLTQGVENSLALVDSLKMYLKSSAKGGSSVLFGESYSNSFRILETQFRGRNFGKINFSFDPRLEDLDVLCTKADLIHILLNLMANSAENLITNAIDNPRIELNLKNYGYDMSSLTISIYDNGTGLSRENYEAFTSLNHHRAHGNTQRIGLGLRLVRRLIERWGGSLTLVELVDRSGTELLLTLRGADKVERNHQSAEKLPTSLTTKDSGNADWQADLDS